MVIENVSKAFSNNNMPFTYNNIHDKYDFLLDQIIIASDKNIPMVKICMNPESKLKPKPYVAKRR